MAGTDRSQEPRLGGPTIILIEPQLGENIGSCARAMLNFGLNDLRLVRPREEWPNKKAVASSSGATEVLDNVKLFDATEDAIADLGYVLASTARKRDMDKEEFSPRNAGIYFRKLIKQGTKVGILYGRESAGLTNDDVSLANAILSFPTNPAFSSLNLAQAVLMTSYEWYVSDAGHEDLASQKIPKNLASRVQLLDFFKHLEGELDAKGFLKPVEKKPKMIRNIRNLFHRADLSDQEVRTLRGVISSLTRDRNI